MKLVHDTKGMLMLFAYFHLEHLITQVLNPFILSVWEWLPLVVLSLNTCIKSSLRTWQLINSLYII